MCLEPHPLASTGQPVMNVVMSGFHNFSALAVCAAVFGAAFTSHAETLLGKHGDWEALTEKENNALACYMGSVPTKARGKYKKRGKTFLLITHRPAEKSKNVISFRGGYTFKKGSEIDIIVGKTTYKLFTDGGWAFAPDADADTTLVKAMIRGASMTIKGLSGRGTKTTDTYSLKGFTAAYRAISKACKI